MYEAQYLTLGARIRPGSLCSMHSLELSPADSSEDIQVDTPHWSSCAATRGTRERKCSQRCDTAHKSHEKNNWSERFDDDIETVIPQPGPGNATAKLYQSTPGPRDDHYGRTYTARQSSSDFASTVHTLQLNHYKAHTLD